LVRFVFVGGREICVQLGRADHVAVVAFLVLVNRHFGTRVWNAARGVVFVLELFEFLVNFVPLRRARHTRRCPLAGSSAVGVERDFELEAFVLHKFLRVVDQFHGAVKNGAFHNEHRQLDALEVNVLLIELFGALSIFVVRPSHHEHVADFELVFLRADVVEAHDLLLDRVHEALRVEHADEFVPRFRGVAGAHKSVQLCPAFFVLLVPVGNRTHHPGDFFTGCVEEPRLRDLVVEDGADCLREVCGHDDFTLDCCADVVQRCFHDFDD